MNIRTHALTPRRTAVARPVFGDFDRLFDEFWRGFGTPLARRASEGTPRMDVRETDEAFELRAEMPGLEEKDIEVTIEDGVLTLAGHREEQEESEEDGIRHLETYRGSFHRAVKLPNEVDADGVTAGYRNGMLTVTLPKVAEAKSEARSIPVSTS